MAVCADPSSVDVAASRDRAEMVLAQLDQLPTLPAVASRLLAVTSSNASSASDVARIIESDSSLTSAVLRLVCRSDLGVQDRGMTVQRVVSLLGFSAVRNAVLSIQLFDALAYSSDDSSQSSLRTELWRHSLAVACAAEMIAREAKLQGVNGEAFICGLLHDVGKLALFSCLPKAYLRATHRVDRDRVCICDAEREVIGIDHTVAGKYLLQRWGMPGPVLECAWLHHQAPDALPTTVAASNLVRTVHLADVLVRQEGIGYSGFCDIEGIQESAESMGLGASALDRIRQRLPEHMAPYLESLSMDAAPDQAERMASLQQANQQLGKLNRELADRVSQLEGRAAGLDVVGAFVARLGKFDRPSEICVAAARSVRDFLGHGQVLVLAHGDAGDRYHFGWCSAPDRTGGGVVRLDGDATSTSIDDAKGPSPDVDMDRLRLAWQRCTGAHPSAPLRHLPLGLSDATPCWCLVMSTEPDVTEIRHLDSAASALRAPFQLALDSAARRVLAERMSEELLDLNRKMRGAQSMLVRDKSVSMVASMAAGAAHELNNPLSVISGRAQMQLSQCDDPDQQRVWKIILDQATNAAGIVNELMAFAKPAPPQPIAFSLAELLEPLRQHWHAGLSLESGAITVALGDSELMVYADRSQTSEVLEAVVTNAVEASLCPREGAAHGSVKVQINSPSCSSDENVRIVVTDDGVGMTHEVLEHAIDPFFSSRGAGRGRGLGLSLAYRLTELNGGRLWFESQPGQGTVVTVELPARAPTSET